MDNYFFINVRDFHLAPFRYSVQVIDVGFVKSLISSVLRSEICEIWACITCWVSILAFGAGQVVLKNLHGLLLHILVKMARPVPQTIATNFFFGIWWFELSISNRMTVEMCNNEPTANAKIPV